MSIVEVDKPTDDAPVPAVGPVQPGMEQVMGPTALTGDWRRFMSLTWVMAKKDYKLSYFGSVLGYVWALMQPLLFFGVLYLMFAVVLDYSKGIKDFPVLLLMNIVLFGFFQSATSASITSVINRENIVRKMHFPRLAIPLAAVTTQLINTVFNLVVVVVFMLAYGVHPRWTWLFLPVIVVCIFVFCFGLAMLLSALYVRYRDVAPIWGVVSQAMYFASPVFIVIDNVLPHGAAVTRYYLFNPMASLLQQARGWMIGPAGGDRGGLGPGLLMGGKIWLLVPVGIVLAIFIGGYATFSHMAPKIAEEL